MLKQIKRSQHQDNATANAQEIQVCVASYELNHRLMNSILHIGFIYLQILIRFPNGERKEKSFSRVDKIEAIFKFIDSIGLPGVGKNYKLISSFPREVFDVDQTKMTLKDAGFYPKATLFIEIV